MTDNYVTWGDNDAVEWLSGDKNVSKVACITATQRKMKNRIRRLHELHPDEVVIDADNEQCLLAHFPASWVKITPPRQMTEEQRQAARERLLKYRNGEIDLNEEELENLEEEADDAEFIPPLETIKSDYKK